VSVIHQLFFGHSGARPAAVAFGGPVGAGRAHREGRRESCAGSLWTVQTRRASKGESRTEKRAQGVVIRCGRVGSRSWPVRLPDIGAGGRMHGRRPHSRVWTTSVSSGLTSVPASWTIWMRTGSIYAQAPQPQQRCRLATSRTVDSGRPAWRSEEVISCSRNAQADEHAPGARSCARRGAVQLGS
jgi:hypothetical protein